MDKINLEPEWRQCFMNDDLGHGEKHSAIFERLKCEINKDMMLTWQLRKLVLLGQCRGLKVHGSKLKVKATSQACYPINQKTNHKRFLK